MGETALKAAGRHHAATLLTPRLQELGLSLRRFKTGTPPRVNRRSVDFSKMELQTGDENPLPFFLSDADCAGKPGWFCYLTYTNAETHRIILPIWTVLRCTTAPLKAPVPATVPLSKQRSYGLLIKRAISFRGTHGD